MPLLFFLSSWFRACLHRFIPSLLPLSAPSFTSLNLTNTGFFLGCYIQQHHLILFGFSGAAINLLQPSLIVIIIITIKAAQSLLDRPSSTTSAFLGRHQHLFPLLSERPVSAPPFLLFVHHLRSCSSLCDRPALPATSPLLAVSSCCHCCCLVRWGSPALLLVSGSLQ